MKRGSGSLRPSTTCLSAQPTPSTRPAASRYADPATGQVIEGTAYAEDYKADSENNQQLEVTAKVVQHRRSAGRWRPSGSASTTSIPAPPPSPSLGDPPPRWPASPPPWRAWGAWDGKYIVKHGQAHPGRAPATRPRPSSAAFWRATDGLRRNPYPAWCRPASVSAVDSTASGQPASSLEETGHTSGWLTVRPALRRALLHRARCRTLPAAHRRLTSGGGSAMHSFAEPQPPPRVPSEPGGCPGSTTGCWCSIPSRCSTGTALFWGGYECRSGYARRGRLRRVGRSAVETITSFAWSGSARYSTHRRHLTHALTEFVPGSTRTGITFDIFVSAYLGVDPMTEVVKIWNYERRRHRRPADHRHPRLRQK